MELKNYKDLIVERSNKFMQDNTLGVVLKTPEDLGTNTYGVYIPRLMMGINVKNGPEDITKSISNSKCANTVNKDIGDDKILFSNYLSLTMDTLYNISMPTLIAGEKVTIGVIDQDIKSLYIKPFARDQIKNRPTDVLEMYVPASGNFDGEDLTDDNRYFCRLDSENQMIRLHMSDAQGEKAQYDLVFDGENGIMTLTDGGRAVSIVTETDEIFLKTEAGATIAMKEKAIDVNCETFYLEATDSIDIKSPLMNVEVDTVNETITDYTGEIDNFEMSGDKMKTSYAKVDRDSDKIDINCPVTNVSGGLVWVEGYVCAGGLGFGAMKGMEPLPISPQISPAGVATLGNKTAVPGMPLVKGPMLMSILQMMMINIDLAMIAGPIPLPPTTMATAGPLMSSMSTMNVKG